MKHPSRWRSIILPQLRRKANLITISRLSLRIHFKYYQEVTKSLLTSTNQDGFENRCPFPKVKIRKTHDINKKHQYWTLLSSEALNKTMIRSFWEYNVSSMNTTWHSISGTNLRWPFMLNNHLRLQTINLFSAGSSTWRYSPPTHVACLGVWPRTRSEKLLCLEMTTK